MQSILKINKYTAWTGVRFQKPFAALATPYEDGQMEKQRAT